MCLFLWQTSSFPVLGQGNQNEPANSTEGAVKIVVQRGETLWGLAQSNHTTVDEIVKLNNVKSADSIREGESLWIPGIVAEPKPEKTEDITVPENTVKTSWWINALRRSAFQVGAILPRSIKTLQESTIKTSEFFVNQETPEPPLTNTMTEDIATVEKRSVKAALADADSQIISRSLGRMVSKEDVELLTRVIHAEARGEDFEGQVAVGAVVLNRLKDPRFPKTIQKVIYQSGAFTAVYDKQIELEPDDESYKAAKAALEGQDPTNGAIFYFNPRIATDRWITTRPVIKTIGNHTFSS